MAAGAIRARGGTRGKSGRVEIAGRSRSARKNQSAPRAVEWDKLMVFEKIAQPDSADDVARVVDSRRPAAEAARVNNSRHTCCCIYFSKTISLSVRGAEPGPHRVTILDPQPRQSRFASCR